VLEDDPVRKGKDKAKTSSGFSWGLWKYNKAGNRVNVSTPNSNRFNSYNLPSL